MRPTPALSGRPSSSQLRCFDGANETRRLEGDYGRLCPDLDLTSPMSEALIPPATFTSSRKFALVTGEPDCALACAMSEEFTVLFPVVSPISMPAVTIVLGRTEPKQSVTVLKVTVICCTSETPVKFTVIMLPLKVGGPDTVPTPEVTAALPLTTLLVKVKTKV